jgi:hypothetical protein
MFPSWHQDADEQGVRTTAIAAGPSQAPARGRDHVPAGHSEPARTVEAGVNTTHHPIRLVPPAARRPARCLHHTVWMARCEDCRAAHAYLLDRSRGGAPAAP